MQFPPSKTLQTVSHPFWAYFTKSLKRSKQTVFRSQVGRGIELWNRDTRCQCHWCQCMSVPLWVGSKHQKWQIAFDMLSIASCRVTALSQLGERRGDRRLNPERDTVGHFRGDFRGDMVTWEDSMMAYREDPFLDSSGRCNKSGREWH